MRTEKEIDHAIAQVLAAMAGGNTKTPEDAFVKGSAVMIVKALRWAKGVDEPGGFSDMLADLDRVDTHGRN